MFSICSKLICMPQIYLREIINNTPLVLAFMNGATTYFWLTDGNIVYLYTH